MTTRDCSTEITGYHDNRVRLGQKERDILAGNRDANRDRVKRGQKRNGKPAPKDFVTQGSYAMFTINKHPDNLYDIDDGVIFDREELKGKQGADMTALEARDMVREAVDDGSFKKAPERRKRCVRVYYDAGHTVDIPVYRRHEVDGKVRLDHAASDWRERDPEGVTRWFQNNVTSKSPDSTNGQQMRRVVRLFKNWANSRPSWVDMPSGLILSVLVNERYVSFDKRDDQSLYNTLNSVKARLEIHLEVDHPVIAGEKLTNAPDDARMKRLRDRLTDALADLAVVDQPSCKWSEALKAWKKFFKTDYFDDAIDKAEKEEKAAAKALVSGFSFSAAPKAWCLGD